MVDLWMQQWVRFRMWQGFVGAAVGLLLDSAVNLADAVLGDWSCVNTCSCGWFVGTVGISVEREGVFDMALELGLEWIGMQWWWPGFTFVEHLVLAAGFRFYTTNSLAGEWKTNRKDGQTAGGKNPYLMWNSMLADCDIDYSDMAALSRQQVGGWFQRMQWWFWKCSAGVLGVCYTLCRSRPYIQHPTCVCSTPNGPHLVTFGIARNGTPQSELGLFTTLSILLYLLCYLTPDSNYLPHVHLMASPILL